MSASQSQSQSQVDQTVNEVCAGTLLIRLTGTRPFALVGP